MDDCNLHKCPETILGLLVLRSVAPANWLGSKPNMGCYRVLNLVGNLELAFRF